MSDPMSRPRCTVLTHPSFGSNPNIQKQRLEQRFGFPEIPISNHQIVEVARHRIRGIARLTKIHGGGDPEQKVDKGWTLLPQ